MELKLNNKTYATGEIKAKAFRKSIEIKEKVDFNNMDGAGMDTVVDFIAELYGNQFTRDEFYEGMNAKELIPTISRSVNGILTDVTDALSPKNA